MHDLVSRTSLAFPFPYNHLPVKSIFPSFNPRTYDPLPPPPLLCCCVYRCIYRCIYQGAGLLAGKFEWDESSRGLWRKLVIQR